MRNDAAPGEVPRALVELVAELEPARLVLGIPLQTEGEEEEMAREARRFGKALEEATGVPVVERDETLTTEDARRALIEAGVPRGRRSRKGADDIMAATLLLRRYLEAEGRE